MADDQDEIERMRDRMHELNNVVQATLLKHATIAQNVDHLVEGFKEHREDSKIFMRETVDTLRKIQEQTTKTNGRVDGHDREFADLRRHRASTHEQRRAITVTIPAGAISAKTVTTVIAGVLAGLIAAWKAGLFG